ncbi:MAG: NHLP bacteriocin system secretion protein [Isosphaeraceae bacterium]
MAKRSSQGLASLLEERPVEAFEQLNVAERVVPLHNWFFLAAAFLTLGAFAAFSFWWQVPLKLEGRGILLAKSSKGAEPVLQVTAPATGRLGKVAVTIGATVKAGDVLAEIEQKELKDEVASATANLALLREEDARMSQLDDDETRARDETEGKLKQAIRRSIELDRSRLAVHRRIVAADQSLKARQMVTESEALKSRSSADEVECGVAADETKLHQIDYDRVRDDTARRRASLKRKLAVSEAQTRLALLEARLERDTRIVSPYAGTVVDVLITPQAPVQVGTPAVLLRPTGTEYGALEAIIFVPAGLGKKVRVGDFVEVSPDTVQRQVHGFIRGEIHAVSEMPCTEGAMLAELKHPALVASFIDRYRGQVLLIIHGALREAHASAAYSSRAPLNKLDWSSSSGAYQPVSSGTLCSASIVVDRRPLISMAMPWFKGLIGLD